MSINVRRLMALPEWAGTAELVAGAAGLDREVRTVRPVVTADKDHAAVAYELVVVTNLVSPADWRIDALLRRVADAEGAGVLLAVDPAELLRSTRLLGDRLGTPLLVTTAAPLDLLVAARLLLAAPELDRAELVMAAHRALGDRLRPPEEVVTVVRELLGSPAGLLDDRGQPLAGELTEAGRVRCDEPVPQRIETTDGVLLAHPVRLPQRARPTLWVAAELGGAAAARADVVAPALVVAAGSVQRWLLAHRLEQEGDARSRNALLGDLLRLEGDPSTELRRRLADAGWSLGGWHVGLRIGALAGVDVVARGQEVTKALRAEGVDVVVVEHGDGWTAWTTSAQEPTSAQVRELAARLRAAHRKLQGVVSDYMGVGRPHARPDGLACTVAEATDAARLAATRPETGHFLHVDQLGMAQLLLEWTRTDTFEPAARALVAPLRGHPGDLIRTLATYLDAESSIAETAAVLGVHRNTVSARIDRIERLLGVDLAHRDERLALHLACRTTTLAGQDR